MVRSDVSDEWQKGTLGELHIVTSESRVVGLKATSAMSGIDMQLFYGARDDLVQELTYNSANQTWQSGFSFTTLNGNNGIDFFLDRSIHYIVGLNSAYQLEAWWKDFNDSSVATPTHPVGIWTKGE